MSRAARPKTGFDAFVDAQMKYREFASAYAEARTEIDAIDQVVRALDQARIDLGISKADLARRIDAKPEFIRRLFTTEEPNPTVSTIAKLAGVLGLRFALVPAKLPRKAAPNKTAKHGSSRRRAESPRAATSA